METIQLKNKHGVIININLNSVDSVRDLGKEADTSFVNIGPVEIEVKGKAKGVAKQIAKARGHEVPIITSPVISGDGEPLAFRENLADGPFDTETGLATDTAPPPEFEIGNASGDIPDDEKGMMGT